MKIATLEQHLLMWRKLSQPLSSFFKLMVLSQADKILEEVDWLINRMKNYLGSEAAGNIYEGPLL